MSYTLSSEPYAILCEGLADRTFLEKLLDARKITGFQFVKIKNFDGNGSFGKQFSALAGDADGYSKIRGIVVIVDAGDNPKKVLKNVCKSIANDGPFDRERRFKKPISFSCLTPQPEGHPFVWVVKIPCEGVGALETILAQAIYCSVPHLDLCISTYLNCANSEIAGWPIEKQHKARMQCAVAALNRDDPSKSISYIHSITPPIVDLGCAVFDSLVSELIKFKAEIEG